MMKQIVCELVATLVVMIGITGMIGVLFDVERLRDWGFAHDIALPTATAFIIIGACLKKLLARK